LTQRDIYVTKRHTLHRHILGDINLTQRETNEIQIDIYVTQKDTYLKQRNTYVTNRHIIYTNRYIFDTMYIRDTGYHSI